MHVPAPAFLFAFQKGLDVGKSRNVLAGVESEAAAQHRTGLAVCLVQLFKPGDKSAHVVSSCVALWCSYFWISSFRACNCLPMTLSARTSARIAQARSEEHTSGLQSLMRISYAVFCLKKKHTY